MCRFSVFVIILFCVTVGVTESRRSGGGSRRNPVSRPSAPRQPAPNSNSGTVRPLGFEQPHHSATTRPLGFDPPRNPSAPIEPPKYNSPVASAPHGSGTVRPLGFDTSGQHPSGSTHLGQPSQNSGTVRPLGFDQSGYHPSGSTHTGQPVGPPRQHATTGQNPPPYNPAGYGPPPNNPAGYGPPPPYTPGNFGQGGYNPQGNYQHGYNPQGGYQHGYHPQGGYQHGYNPQSGGPVIINNNYQGGYGGYSPPVYTSRDTGSTALGLFLGYSLAKITTPSFAFQNNNNNNNGPVYDHYTVHHYYHNKENIPSEATIQPNAIVACIGDSGSFCPANTTSLCTNNGAVMCVASATSTIPCSGQKQTNCVKSYIPCKNNNATECKESQDKASIAIPCISTAKIYGHISYVNNSIVVSNSTVHNSTQSSGNISTSSAMNSTTSTALSNSTVTDSSAGVTTTEASSNVTTAENNTNVTSSSNTTVDKKEEPQMFCVTILALPAERKPSPGEQLFINAENIFSNFLVKALGIN